MEIQNSTPGPEVPFGPFTTIPDYVFGLRLSVQAFRVYMHLKTLYDLGRSPDGVRETARTCLMSENSVRKALRELVGAQLAAKLPALSVAEAKRRLEAKAPQADVGFGCECTWCGCLTAWLHDHHYPIFKSAGGTETVAICPNCHAEFHALTRDRYQIARGAE